MRVAQNQVSEWQEKYSRAKSESDGLRAEITEIESMMKLYRGLIDKLTE